MIELVKRVRQARAGGLFIKMSPSDLGIECCSQGTRFLVKSPYYPEWVVAARMLGGRWEKPHWSFDEGKEPEIRRLMGRMYGTGARFTFPVCEAYFSITPLSSLQQCVFGLGRELVKRTRFDRPVRLHSTVKIAEGSFPESGGEKGDAIIANGGKVLLRVQDVPIALIEPGIEMGNVADVKIPQPWIPMTPEVEYLLQQRAHYLTELTEIDERLEKLGWEIQ